jgi:MYXO-CTERM domain-containing protein
MIGDTRMLITRTRLLTCMFAAACGVGLLTGAPERAEAFCGFYVAGADAALYNDATMVVLMRDGKRTVLAMQNDYQGPPEDFAMVVPVPVVLGEDDVKTLPKEVFARVDKLAAPRLVEYWEQDPCSPWPPENKAMSRGAGVMEEPAPPSEEEGAHGVKIEAQFTVAEYEIVILSASNSTGLDKWLRESGYKIPEGAEPLLRPYVQDGMKFFVAKVDVEKVKFERRPDGSQAATLSPLRFHYDSEQFNLPIRLGLINAPDGAGTGAQDLLVHVLARGQRYQAANYPNVTIPTNLDVKDGVRGHFGEFYVSLFDHTLAQNPKAVVTEYAWAANTCDPCPEPALTLAELVTLGADVLPSYAGKLGAQEISSDLEWSVPSEFVLTRLHARYDRSSLGEDLVFEEAPAIAGGREFMSGTDRQLERGAQPSSDNQFQARYIIRHAWTGKIDCDKPVRGVWGGPPGDPEQRTQPTVARQLATAPRDGDLASFVTADAGAQLGIAVLEAPPPTEEKAAPDQPKAEPRAASKSDNKTADNEGCRCAIEHEPTGVGFALLGLLALLGVRRKRLRFTTLLDHDHAH